MTLPTEMDLVLAHGAGSTYLYKYPRILPSERKTGNIENVRSQISCDSAGQFTSGFDFSTYKFQRPKFLGEDFIDFRRDPSGFIYKLDDESEGKVSCDFENSDCNVLIGSISEPITLPEDVILNRISIYKEGTLNRTESVDTQLIAMNAHNIRDFHTVEEVETFVEKSATLMNKFDIVKNLSYDSGTDKTTVRIQLENFDEADITNLTIYQVIPKDVAAHFDDINFISTAGEMFVLDKDPVIGWYFNESTGDEEIEYEVDGDTEGGTIIITQEAILFNEGDLVVKYREVDCNADEVNLFELDDLEGSNVSVSGTGSLYRVCLSHLNSSITINKGSGERNISVVSYEDGGKISDDIDDFAEKLVLGVDGYPSMYWSTVISQANPNGDYSCVGSFESLADGGSLFGDCGYKEENRLWIHFGEDIEAPTTTLTMAYVSHSIPVTLTAKDDIAGSGVQGINYCVADDEDGCDPVTDGTYVDGDTAELVVKCPNLWGCVKFVIVSAEDNEGNKEVPNSIPVTLIDVGSACQSDCTVKPSPGRYFYGCNNLNSCNFYDYNDLGQFDDGVYVANACDLSIEGSYVPFNSSHEIACPNGPFRKNRYGDETIDVSRSTCLNLQSVDYPAIVDGENMIMKIFVCVDKFK